MPGNVQPQQAQAPPPFDPVAEFRKVWPQSTFTDAQIVQGLQDPTKFRKAFPQYVGLDDATIQHNMSKIAPPASVASSSNPQVVRYMAPGAGVQDFVPGSTGEQSFLKQYPTAKKIPIPAGAGGKTSQSYAIPSSDTDMRPLARAQAEDTAGMQQGIKTAVGTVAGAALPEVAGAVAPELMASATALGGAAKGAALGGAALGGANVIGQAAAGENPLTGKNLADTAKATGIGLVTGGAGGAIQGAEAASAAKAAQEAEVASKVAAQQALKNSAVKVANIASKAEDDGVTLDAGKSVYSQFVKNASLTDRNEFLNDVQPVLDQARQATGIKNLTTATPTQVLAYRDKVAELLSGPRYKEYQEPIYEAITSDLQNAIKGNKYPGFKFSDNNVPIGNNVLKLASKLGNAADDVAAAGTNFQTTKIPTKEAVDVDAEENPTPGQSNLGKVMSAVGKEAIGVAKYSPKYLAGRMLWKAATKLGL